MSPEARQRKNVQRSSFFAPKVLVNKPREERFAAGLDGEVGRPGVLFEDGFLSPPPPSTGTLRGESPTPIPMVPPPPGSALRDDSPSGKI